MQSLLLIIVLLGVINTKAFVLTTRDISRTPPPTRRRALQQAPPLSPLLLQRSFLTKRTASLPLLSTNNNNISNSDHDQDDSSNKNQEQDNSSSSSSSFQNKVRVAKLKAEIDALLSGPDAVFDLESELLKCESISSTGLAFNTPEYRVEQQVAELESELYNAVQNTNLEQASSMQHDLSTRHVDDCGAVLQVNSKFYRCLGEKSITEMQQIWLQGTKNEVTCIHPSLPILYGYNAIMDSYNRMFQATAGSFQRNWMEPTNISLVVKGTTAILTCDEHVYTRRFVRGQRRQTEHINTLIATNIFRKVNNTWYMVHHHGSWHADSDAAKSALNANKNRSSGRIVESTPTSSGLLLKRRRRASTDEQQKQRLASDGILGNFGPILGTDKDKNSSGKEGSKPPVKRIVLGSLSDILNGGLGDILADSNANDDSEDDDDDDEESQEESGKAIIQFHRIDSDNDQDDDVLDDDDDDMDDDEEEDEEDYAGEAVSIVQEWASTKGEKRSSRKSTKSNNTNSAPKKDALRQKTISALRKLANQGSISPKQKRVLLTDIISCSAKGEFSMVEVAYELLCGEGEDQDAAEEEFADQCRVFAQSVPESPPSQELQSDAEL